MRNLLVVAAALLVGLMAVAAVAPTSSEAQAAKPFKVSSRIGWQQTPLYVSKGSEYSVAYKIGDWTVDYRNFEYVGPQGYPPSIDSQIYQGCKLNSNWPYARLLGKVGTNGSLFSVGGNSFSNLGDVRTFTASTNGSLYLRIHDDDRCLGDNGGSITVNLSTGKEPETGGAPPAAPSKLSVAAVDSRTIRVKWVDNSDNEDGFQIHNGETTRTVGANKTTYDWGGLTPGTYMCFRVRAYNKAGSSAWEPNKSPWYKCTTTPSTPSSATKFQYPLRGGNHAPNYAKYGVANPNLAARATCFGDKGHYLNQLSHAGEDWFRSPGTPVYPVAAGKVWKVLSWDHGTVIVEHRLPQVQPWGSDRIYSAYLHVRNPVAEGTEVGLDTKLAEVNEYWLSNGKPNHHLHWELRQFASMVNSPLPKACKSIVGPSYTDTGTNPDDYGYLNPSKWVNNHG